VADVESGSAPDLTVAREHVLGALYWAASHLDLPALAEGGYEGAGIGVHTPIKQPAGDQILDVDNRTYNALLRDLRCQANADSPSSPAAGAPSTPPPDPARSATSSKPPSHPPISNTADPTEVGEITSVTYSRAMNRHSTDVTARDRDALFGYSVPDLRTVFDQRHTVLVQCGMGVQVLSIVRGECDGRSTVTGCGRLSKVGLPVRRCSCRPCGMLSWRGRAYDSVCRSCA
jgi:hypothetical protein